MTLDELRNAVAAMSELPGDLELVFADNEDYRLRNCALDFEVTGRDSKDKQSNYDGTPVLLVWVQQ